MVSSNGVGLPGVVSQIVGGMGGAMMNSNGSCTITRKTSGVPTEVNVSGNGGDDSFKWSDAMSGSMNVSVSL